MTIASIYARYSSDSQREESIEIQVEGCTRLIEAKGWELGEVYADYAYTGTNDRRPGFQKAIADGEAGLYDVLVVYKTDRFARNVVISKQYKDRLKKAGRRIWSVREGESLDTPEGFFHETIDEVFAEHYSRKLSVDIRDGIQKNASELKASGMRIFGYDVDDSDHFVINPREAFFVREVFERKLKGHSVNEIVRWLDSEGVRTKHGNPYSKTSISKMLHNPAYAGQYHYAGHVVEDGMPAIVDKGVFYMVQDLMEKKQTQKRASANHDYIFTGKAFCLRCGKPLIGDGATSHTGRKHPYYACTTKDGCGLYVPAQRLEDTVMGNLREILLDDGSVESMAMALDYYLDHEKEKDDREQLAEEHRNIKKERDRLIKSIGAGVNPEAVSEMINKLQERLEDIEMRQAKAEYTYSSLAKPEDLREFVREAIARSETSSKLQGALFREHIGRLYADKDHAIVMFTLGAYDEDEMTLDLAKALVETNPAHNGGVRISELWWAECTVIRTLIYRVNDAFIFVMETSPVP